MVIRVVAFLSLTMFPAILSYRQEPSTDLRQADVYAIYSLMMANPQTSHAPAEEETFLIASTTEPAYPQTPCVAVPPEYHSSLQEILTDYGIRGNTPATLIRAFNIPKPYRLLTAEEAQDFVEIRSLRPTPYPNAKEFLLKAHDLYQLGDVYFNAARTVALTSLSIYCGSLCGRSDWKVFVKTETGRWEERRWVTCNTVY